VLAEVLDNFQAKLTFKEFAEQTLQAANKLAFNLKVRSVPRRMFVS
jgi:hypothetical protein